MFGLTDSFSGVASGVSGLAGQALTIGTELAVVGALTRTAANADGHKKDKPMSYFDMMMNP
jgi:hypothetical protein